MTPREHALLARMLIDACGGIDESAAACKAAGWQIERSQMSNYQNPNHRSSMSCEVKDILELYCGKPLYTRAMLEQHQVEQDEVESLVDEVSDATECVAALQAAVRKAAKDDKFTPTEIELIKRLYRKALEELRDAGMAIPEHDN